MDGGPQILTSVPRDTVLDDRYRLDQVRDDVVLPDGRRSVLWRAIDEPLDRRVAVLIVSGRTQAIRQEVAAAAVQASRVHDARHVRVLDIGELAEPYRATWVATEWVDAPSLTAVLRRGPMRPPIATALVAQCAEAIANAARDGVRHGHLHPDRVLVPANGVPRIVGLGIAAAIAGDEPGPSDDVRQLAALLFATLTGRWPLPGWTGLPEALAVTHPRTLRSSIPRDLDEVTARGLGGEYADADAFVRALSVLPQEAPDAPAPPPTPSRWTGVRRWSWRIVPPVVVAAIGITGWEVGSALGRVPLSARLHRGTVPTAAPSSPGSTGAKLVWTTPPAVSSFDPYGDGQENPASVGLAVDGDPSTSWTTQRYKGDPRFGGLKPGVGLLLDLRRPTTVRVAALALSTAGASVEIRAGDTAPTHESDLPVVASQADAPTQLSLSLPRPVTARYWLVWFTRLPPVSDGYRIGVTDVALLG